MWTCKCLLPGMNTKGQHKDWGTISHSYYNFPLLFLGEGRGISELLDVQERKTLHAEAGKAETGQRKVENLLGGQGIWKAYVFLQIRQTFRVHSLWGTWPKSKWDTQNLTIRQTERKTSISQQSSTVGSEFTAEGKVSRQPLCSDDCWIWRDISKGQLKKQTLLEQQQTLPSWEGGYWTSTNLPVLPQILKTRSN